MKRVILSAVLLAAFFGLFWAQRNILKVLPESRVEVAYAGAQEDLEAALAQSESEALELAAPDWDGQRLVFHAPSLFTAQQAAVAFSQYGIDPAMMTVLDYSWANAVLAQSGSLWQLAAAALLLYCLLLLLYRQTRLEFLRARKALQAAYWSAYWEDAGIRLLVKAIVAVLCVFLGIFLVRWLVHFDLALPALLLPQDHLFQTSHYKQWFEAAFPPALCSDYATALLHQWKTASILTGLEYLICILLAGTVSWEKRRNDINKKVIGGISL